jgi:UDP-N-acetylglucosamine--N-acetylmuramyl-(pentapeptide) pyrophosphoryl-undecaprenol N-acetylglucosamine transferase
MTGGGSGGHITPILSLAHELKAIDPDCELVYIGHKGDNFDSLQAQSQDIDFMSFINGGKFRRYHGESFWSHLLDFKTVALNIRDFFRVISAIGTSLRILNRTKPDVLFVKGGFVGVPVGIAARLKGIPIITHDSDTVGGLANKIVGRWAVVHATGMPAKNYGYKQSSVKYVGIPLDPRVKPIKPSDQQEAKSSLHIPEEGFVLLVAGGGQGSQTVNEKILAIAPRLLESNLALHIIHITGSQNLDGVKRDYASSLPKLFKNRVHILGFTGDFYKYVSASDLIISRAGATSIAEYALAGKACIIIPSPFLASGHQLKNAEMLRAEDAAIIIDDNAPPEELLEVVEELAANEVRRKQLAGLLHKLAKPNAAHELAKIIAETAKNN